MKQYIEVEQPFPESDIGSISSNSCDCPAHVHDKAKIYAEEGNLHKTFSCFILVIEWENVLQIPILCLSLC